MKRDLDIHEQFFSLELRSSPQGRAWEELEASVEASLVLHGRTGAHPPSSEIPGQWTGRLAPQVSPAAPVPVAALRQGPRRAPEPRVDGPVVFERFSGVSGPQAGERVIAVQRPSIAPPARRSVPALVPALPNGGDRLMGFRIAGCRYAVANARVRGQGRIQAAHWLRGRVTGDLSFGLGGAVMVDLKRRLGFDGIPGQSYLVVERANARGERVIEAWAVDGVEPLALTYDAARWREPTFAAKRLGIRRVLPGNAPVSLL